MNESFLGGSCRGGIGGVFRNLEGKRLLQFNNKVSVESAVYAELLAFREGILMAAASR